MDFTKWHKRYCIDSTLKYPSENTQKNYQNSVIMFLSYFKNEIDPAHIKTDDIKKWLLSFETINTRNHKLCAIKSFYEITVGMPLKMDKIPFSKRDKKLPKIIEQDEIQKMFDVCQNTKHKTIFSILYACGLRIGEIINLKIDHLNYDTIDIIQAKGRKDRIVPLPKIVKDQILKYINEYNPKEYLFNGQFGLQYSERSINQFLKDLAQKAGIKRNIHAHLLRHSFATHSLEQGNNLFFLQEILGHNNPKTTSIYLHASRKSIGKIPSPISQIRL